ncbi:MAG: MFS transporter [Magnetovibrio sp.]|nr:MFS transporter [Magnetovibrio sp.]
MTGPDTAASLQRGDNARRNVIILAVCQALAMSGSSLVMTISALAGKMLAADPALATLPMALQFTTTMLTTIPASLLMGRIGRRAGFTLGQAFGALGAGVACWALFEGRFLWFAVGSALLGVHNAFWQYYRFAAADTASEEFRAKAISYVLTGGVLAAFLGPQLSKATFDLFEPVHFAGGYVGVIGLSMLTIVLLQFIRIPKPPRARPGAPAGRPLLEIIRQPTFLVAVFAAMVGYSVMTLVMQATPLAMEFCGFGFIDTATVIQWHVLGMFAPSFITGHLIKRIGVINVILIGTLCNFAAMAINLSGIEFYNFWTSLVLLGVGWNFMFIGGTTLVTEAYRPEEQSRVQAFNDFLVFGCVSIAAFGSGVLQAEFGWAAVNMTLAVPVFAVFLASVWYRTRQAAAPAA